MNSHGEWLFLILSLPTQGATARMRIWRALKSLGCAAMRDGAYLLPRTDAHDAALRGLAEECVREGGTAWVMASAPLWPGGDEEQQRLFDRSEDHAALSRAWKEQAATLGSLQPGELTRLQRRLQREYDALRAIDFFPGEASLETANEWADLNGRIQRLLSPDEPHETEGDVPKLDRAKYQGRLWATRRRLWVDRVASAWLIRRFIDPQASFRWLAAPADCPKKALGFDYDGAAFSHVGDRVTFETLLASFDLDSDPALLRLGAMVHFLDIGGEPVPEAKGFEAMLAGARERLADDDALLAEIGGVLDSFYAHFQREASRSNPGQRS
jgi:hypothetical protein